MNPVPPKFEEPKRFFGFSSRDGAILLVGGLLFMSSFIAPFSFTFKVVLAMCIVVVSLVVLFFRTSAGFTIEESLWLWWAYVSRTHYHQRGVDGAESPLDQPQAKSVRLVPRKTGAVDYFWIIWRRIVKSQVVVNAVDRSRAFYALAHGEPSPTYYRSVWIRELSLFVYIAEKRSVFNFLDLRPLYPSVNFWKIVNVMVENSLLTWDGDSVLVCKDVRRMRTLIRHGMLELPDTDNGLLPYESQI